MCLLAQPVLGTQDSLNRNGRWKKSKPFGWVSKGCTEPALCLSYAAHWSAILTVDPLVAMVLESGG